MRIGFNEVALYGIFTLTIALGVNHFGGLNIGFLNSIQRLVIPTTEDVERVGTIADYSIKSPDTVTYEEANCPKTKIFVDQTVTLRKKMRRAKRTGNMDMLKDLELRLNELEEREREACMD